MTDHPAPTHECRGCGARYYGEGARDVCEDYHLIEAVGTGNGHVITGP